MYGYDNWLYSCAEYEAEQQEEAYQAWCDDVERKATRLTKDVTEELMQNIDGIDVRAMYSPQVKSDMKETTMLLIDNMEDNMMACDEGSYDIYDAYMSIVTDKSGVETMRKTLSSAMDLSSDCKGKDKDAILDNICETMMSSPMDMMDRLKIVHSVLDENKKTYDNVITIPTDSVSKGSGATSNIKFHEKGYSECSNMYVPDKWLYTNKFKGITIVMPSDNDYTVDVFNKHDGLRKNIPFKDVVANVDVVKAKKDVIVAKNKALSKRERTLPEMPEDVSAETSAEFGD